MALVFPVFPAKNISQTDDFFSVLLFSPSLGPGISSGRRSHSVQLGARGGNLLDTQLAQLRLELTQGLGEVIAVLRPQLAGLDLAARLRHCQLFRVPD